MIDNTLTNENDGYVYLAKLMIPKNPVYKIGHCSLSKGRLTEYTKLPYDIQYKGFWRTTERKSIEYDLHKKFNKKRLNGEWFDLNDNDLEEINDYFKLLNIPKETVTIHNKPQNQHINKIVKWKETKEPDGYEPLYIIRYKDGIFEEQDCGDVPYIYGSYNHRGVVDKTIKRYPTLNLDEINIKNQTYIYNEYSSEKEKYMKAWGKNRAECYKKLKDICRRRFESEEVVLQRVRTHNSFIQNSINLIDLWENNGTIYNEERSKHEK